MSQSLCETTGCTDECYDTCAKGKCSIGRKHFRKGGVCCATCYWFCTRCSGTFYHEDLNYFTDVTPDGDWETDEDGEVFLCHCCTIAVGKDYRPYVPRPLGEVVATYTLKPVQKKSEV